MEAASDSPSEEEARGENILQIRRATSGINRWLPLKKKLRNILREPEGRS